MEKIKLKWKIFLILGLILFLIGSFGIILGLLLFFYPQISYRLVNYSFLLILCGFMFILISIFPLNDSIKKYWEYFKETRGKELTEKDTIIQINKHKKRENRKALAILIISLLFITSPFPAFCWMVISIRHSQGEIAILNNRDFSLRYSFPGTGSIDDPYIIENLVINTDRRSGIFIKNTNAFFVIRNCTISSDIITISIVGVKTGTGKIINNTLLNGYIDIKESNGITISNNYCNDLLSLLDCSDAIISNNYFDYLLISSYYKSSSNHIIKSNVGHIHIEYSFDCTIINNIYFNKSGAGIIISDSNQISLTNNSCYNNSIGINIVDSNFIYLIDNRCVLNDGQGINIIRTNNLLLSGNYLFKNTIGLELDHSNYATIIENIIINNTNYGLLLQSSVITISIFHNNFLHNNLLGTSSGIAQAYDDSFSSLVKWYNPTFLAGNFWSDLIWNEGVTYEIDGSANNADLYPLENPVII